MKEKQRSLWITEMPEELEKQALQKIAQLKTTKSEYIRECIKENLKVTSYKEDLDFITQVIRRCVTDIMTGFLERVASINAKSSRASITSTYISGLCISSLIHRNRQKDIEYIIQKASKYAGVYLKSKDPDMKLSTFIGDEQNE